MLNGRASPTPNPSLFGASDDVVIGEVDRYGLPIRTVACSRTGLIRSDPYYSTEYLSRFYTEHYRCMYMGGELRIEDYLAQKIRKGGELCDFLGPWMKSRAAVLDVGCAAGGMLVPFKLRGYETFGCDYGRDYLQYGAAMGLNVEYGDCRSQAQNGPFNVVILCHVLEHLIDPIDSLSAVRDVISDDGILYVEVPGLADIPRAYHGDLLAYLQNAHVWHFSKETIVAALKRAGFESVYCDDQIRCVARVGTKRPDAVPESVADIIGLLSAFEKRLADRRSGRKYTLLGRFAHRVHRIAGRATS